MTNQTAAHIQWSEYRTGTCQLYSGPGGPGPDSVIAWRVSVSNVLLLELGGEPVLHVGVLNTARGGAYQLHKQTS